MGVEELYLFVDYYWVDVVGDGVVVVVKIVVY